MCEEKKEVERLGQLLPVLLLRGSEPRGKTHEGNVSDTVVGKEGDGGEGGGLLASVLRR